MKRLWFKFTHGVRGHLLYRTYRRAFGTREHYALLCCSDCDAEILL